MRRRCPLSQIVKVLRSDAEDYGLSDWEISVEAGLCEKTVYGLLSGATRFPRFQTVWNVAYVLGYELEMTAREDFKLKRVA